MISAKGTKKNFLVQSDVDTFCMPIKEYQLCLLMSFNSQSHVLRSSTGFDVGKSFSFLFSAWHVVPFW